MVCFIMRCCSQISRNRLLNGISQFKRSKLKTNHQLLSKTSSSTSRPRKQDVANHPEANARVPTCKAPTTVLKRNARDNTR